jgi:hypothetical protein
MSDEEINIKIAEACGWRDTRLVDHASYGYRLYRRQLNDRSVKHEYRLGNQFDYCECLNAMHKAEKVLTQDQRGQIVDELCEIVLREKNTESGPMTAIIAAFFATARQRAEAFLRTMGKWEEAK